MTLSLMAPWIFLALLSASLGCQLLPSVPGYTFQNISVLSVAVIYNSTDDIETLVDQGCDPNYNGTFITYTSNKCSIPILEILGVNCTREIKVEGYTPLVLAVMFGSTNVVQKLVTIPGIDLDAKSDVGPAVIEAARRGKLGMVRALKEAGANMNNVGGSNEISPVAAAIYENQIDVARYLINQGVNVNIAGKDGATPVFTAAQIGNLEIMKMLQKAGAVLDTVGGPNKVSAVGIAAEGGFLKVVDFLISEGVDLDRQGLDGDSPAYLAASYGHLDVLKALRSAGASLDIPSGSEQFTALAAAILTGNSKIAIYLIKNGANLQLKSEKGSTPAFLAAQKGDLAVMKAIAEAGGDLETQGPSSLTPVAFAAYFGHEAVVRFLIDQGVDLSVRDVDGNSALDLAEAQGFNDIARMLRTADQ